MKERFHVRRVNRQRVLPWPSCKRRLHLSIHTVTCIAGRAHCGHPVDERTWVARGAVLIVAGALLRAGAAFVPDVASVLLGLAGGVWAAVLAHQASVVARAARWVVGVSGVGRQCC